MDAKTPLSPPPPLPQNIWLHGLVMLVLVILVNLAQTVLGVCAILQFLWMLLSKERNARIADFGEGVANWLTITARFLSGGSDDRPFPWTDWR
jgi:Flp pilus assembly protein TadB